MASEGSFAGKVVMITGAGRGLGRAIALDLASRGAAVYAIDIDEALIDALRAEHAGDGQLVCLAADASHRSTIMDVAAQAAATHGGLDAVVANAAIIQYEPIADVTEEMLSRRFAVSVNGAVWLAQALVAHRAPGAPAVWLGMTSPVGERGIPRTALYGMTKAAIGSLTRSLAAELGPQGIRAVAIAPGSVPTPGAVALTSEADYAKRVTSIPMRRLGADADVVAAARYLLSDEAGFINGEILHVDGGASAVL